MNEHARCAEGSAFRLLVIAAALAASVVASTPTLADQPEVPSFAKITVTGEEPRNGLFDPSIEYDNTGTGWLAYSRVTLPKHVETHLARSMDRGETWSFVSALNRSTEQTVVINGVSQSGVWRYETPTLLYDPGDVPARRWKLFVQRYLAIPPFKRGDSLFESGWIAQSTAPDPAGPWSEAKCLFGKDKDVCRVDLNSLHPDLEDFVFFNELGSVMVGDAIYLSMDASPTSSGLGKWKHRKIVLLTSPDHGATWKYVGVLTDYKDARQLGYRVLTGSSLVKENDRLFLLVTPSGAKGLFRKNRAHDGTLVVEFEDIRRAKLQRDEDGKLRVLKSFKPNLHSGGLSDYDEKNTSGGILFSQIDLGTKPEFFKIFNTRQLIFQPGTSVGAAAPRH